MSNPSSRGNPFAAPPSADDDFAQRAIVHVERAPPGDAAQIDAERIAPIDVIVDHRRKQIVRRGDRVEIAGEMQIDRIHRHDLCVTAPGGPALQRRNMDQATARAGRSPSARLYG